MPFLHLRDTFLSLQYHRRYVILFSFQKLYELRDFTFQIFQYGGRVALKHPGSLDIGFGTFSIQAGAINAGSRGWRVPLIKHKGARVFCMLLGVPPVKGLLLMTLRLHFLSSGVFIFRTGFTCRALSLQSCPPRSSHALQPFGPSRIIRSRWTLRTLSKLTNLFSKSIQL